MVTLCILNRIRLLCTFCLKSTHFVEGNLITLFIDLNVSFINQKILNDQLDLHLTKYLGIYCLIIFTHKVNYDFLKSILVIVMFFICI